MFPLRILLEAQTPLVELAVKLEHGCKLFVFTLESMQFLDEGVLMVGITWRGRVVGMRHSSKLVLQSVVRGIN